MKRTGKIVKFSIDTIGGEITYIYDKMSIVKTLLLSENANRLTSSLYKPATSDDAQNGSVEEWINISASKFATESTFNMPDEAGDSSICNANRTNLSKKSLVSRLDTIAKGKIYILYTIYFNDSPIKIE